MMTALWAAKVTIPPSPTPTDLTVDAAASFTLDTGIVTAVITAAVAITIAVLTPALQSRQQRRDAVHAKFDAATAALLMVQAMKDITHGMPEGIYPGTPRQFAEYDRTAVELAVTRFVAATIEARAALAEIAQYVPEAHEWVTRVWRITEADGRNMRKKIEQARAAAVRTERFLRARGDVN